MNTNKKPAWIKSALVGNVSLLTLVYCQPALAQVGAQSDQPTASAGIGLEEIVVTARRREEKAQSVPIAIDNVSATQLENQRILRPFDILSDLTGLVVAETGARNTIGFAVGGGFPSGFQWVRGIPGLIPYWADVPTEANGGMTFDLASVQLLKGPQGTLFGQSTNGGAMLYQPKLPTNNFEGYAEIEAGDYNHTRVEGVVNIPIIDDKLLVRIGGRINHTDGFVYDIAHKTWLGSEGSQDGRLAITFRPTDNIQNDFIANSYTYADTPASAQNLTANPPVESALNIYATGPLAAPNSCGVSAACLVTYGGPLGWYAIPGSPNVPYASFESGVWYNLVNTTRWDILDNLTLKNILGYTEGGAGTSFTAPLNALTYGPQAFGNPIVSWPSGLAVQASEEFQVQGKLLGDKLSYTAGAFYLYSQGSTAPHVINIACARVTLGGIQNGGVATSCSSTVSYSNDRSEAVYAQGTYDLSGLLDGLSFTAGARYTWDSIYGSVNQYVGTPQNGNTPQVVTGVAAGWGQSESSKALGYSMSLDWQIDPTTLLYVTNSKGFSHGGLNVTATLAPGPGRIFAPESLNNVEPGIKADWNLPLDMKARTNVSVFYGFYSNVQVPGSVPILDALGNLTTADLTHNAAQAHNDGIDFDLTLLPTDTVSINYGGVWTQSKYDQYNFCAKFVGNPPACGAGQLYDISSSQFIWDPKWTWHVRVSYTLPLDESLGVAVLSANLQHVGGFYATPGIVPPAVGWPSVPPQDYYRATNMVDISLNWNDFLGNPQLQAIGTVENLFDVPMSSTGSGGHYSTGASQTTVAPPRMWTVALKYSFGGESAPASAPAAYTPPPVQAPAPAPAPAVARSYLVFFDFNKSDLTPQAISIVGQAAKNAGPARVTRITCTGHTDTVGSADYNLRLSRRRAESVAAELEKQGIPSSEIEIVAKGKSDLLVPTGDGVREPQNRRVQIVYSGGQTS